MDFWNSLKVLARRWYIVAVGMLVTLGAAVGVNFLISPSYTAVGSLVLAVPPNLPERATSSNPYLAYGNLAVAARVVASGMNQPSVVREQRSKGATGDFVVDLDPERSSPIITVNSTARTAAEAIKTVEVVTAGVQQLLADRQKTLGAPQNTWITANTVVVPEEANQAIGSRLRAVSAVLVLGVIGTLTLAFGVEGLAQGRAGPDPTAGARLGAAGPLPSPVTAPPAPSPPPEPYPPPPPAYSPALAPVGVCPLCRTAFRSAEDLAWHLEESHGLNGSSAPAAPAPTARPVRRVEPARQPEPPRLVREAPRRALEEAAAAMKPPLRRAARPASPEEPQAPTRAPRKAASPGVRPRKSTPPAP